MRDLILGFCVVFGVLGCDADSKEAGALQSTGGESESSQSEGGGSCESVVSADDFDRSCTVNADCLTVFEGPSTDACRGCGFSAISASERDGYLSEIGPESCIEGECLADCIAGELDRGTCVEGTCEVGLPFLCGEEPCNGAGEYCVVFGSDIEGEGPGFSCEVLPDACSDSTDCECFRDQETSFNVNFCLDVGACSHDERSFEITCPGG